MNVFKMILAVLSLSLSVAHAEELEIKKVSSKIDYPTKGDEKLDVKVGNITYHARIQHPKILEGPHFSSPLFWASENGELQGPDAFTSLKTHVGGLDWLSLNQGYFFTDKKGKFRGFWLEDGFDNWDNGSSGLIVIYQDLKPVIWRWEYIRDPNKPKGHYIITAADDPKTVAPKELIKQLDKVLKLAEKEAKAWPGP